jgi:hypothetical protein
MIEDDTSGQEGGASIDQQRVQWGMAWVHGACERLGDEPTGSLEDYITPRMESECND